MRILPELIENNRRWAQDMVTHDAGYFTRLADHQRPEFLWIGCSDSRVPANQIVDLDSGEVLVHRNIANVVVHRDFNCLSVLEFAVAVLKVKHVIVCGHYGCSGVRAAGEKHHLGLIDNWLRHIRDVRQKHNAILSKWIWIGRRNGIFTSPRPSLASAGVRSALAAPAASSARRGGLRKQLASRRGTALRALDRQIRMGYGRASGGYRFEDLGTARTGRLRGMTFSPV